MSEHKEEAHPKNEHETAIHTPEVKRSRVIGIIVGIVLLIILLIVITKMLKNDPKYKYSVGPEQGQTEEVITTFDYNLLDASYGSYISFNVSPGETKTILLTKDYCPGWSSNQIDVFLDNGQKIVLCGTKILQGENSPSEYYKFVNSHGGKTITIKVARCESKNNCNVNF